MRELLLRDLERRIENQRRKVTEDRERVEDALTSLPKKALEAVGSREGLLISFSAGVTAGGVAPSASSVVLWDLIGRFALEGLPDVRQMLSRWLRQRREATPAEE